MFKWILTTKVCWIRNPTHTIRDFWSLAQKSANFCKKWPIYLKNDFEMFRKRFILIWNDIWLFWEKNWCEKIFLGYFGVIVSGAIFRIPFMQICFENYRSKFQRKYIFDILPNVHSRNRFCFPDVVIANVLSKNAWNKYIFLRK